MSLSERGGPALRLVLLTENAAAASSVADTADLLGHELTPAPLRASAALEIAEAVVLVDARTAVAEARRVCADLAEIDPTRAVVVVFSAAGLSTVSERWQLHDFLVDTASPAELDARLRWATQRARAALSTSEERELVVDTAAFTARLQGRPLDLTFKEFELLAHLEANPGRVCSREHLLQEVWGYDYFGGTRTVDVHVRRLRAKLGPDHEQLISTVRNVGYRFDPRPSPAAP
ncbi:MAG: response regulator transcription factor [Micrococcus sp.]|nr:response regulator transcription factor [Micrococcus sp.]